MDITKKVKQIAWVGLLIGTVAITGCKQNPSTGGPPTSGPPVVGVVTIAVAPVTLTMELSGRTSPHLIAEVRPQVGGIIQKRLFTEGSDVKAGQVLYQLDSATYQAAYASAKAALARAEANLMPVRLKAERFRELVAINAVSRQDYDDASALLKQAEADVAANQAVVEAARINLDYTRVKAPISGRIGRSTVTDGALVTARRAFRRPSPKVLLSAAVPPQVVTLTSVAVESRRASVASMSP